MRYIKALLLVAAAGGFAQAASAADFGALPYTAPSGPAPIVELGSGWYIRGDIGGGEGAQAQFTGDLKVPETRATWTGDIGFGYKLTNYLRTDVTLNYFKPQHLDFTNKTEIICPYNLAQNATGGFLYAPVAGTCNQKGSNDLVQLNALANVYADLGTYFGITPYIGAGVGVAMVKGTGNSDYYKTSDGSAYRSDLTVPAGLMFAPHWAGTNGVALSPQPSTPNGTKLAFGPQDYSRKFRKTNYSIAWALMGGFAYNITDQAAIDVGYQYVDNGTYASQRGPNGGIVKRELTIQQAKVGFRYQLD